ncbi:hypothetical protein [Pseudacidobacterium ailaaui]|uniref:hypothetical protein n=1 Tax=Pseudacidobacterium ailaaui TaxID=1382359 RepID=UPI00047C6E00|nr:hypothetical protein [Pseudacidobacterium ailaaui]
MFQSSLHYLLLEAFVVGMALVASRWKAWLCLASRMETALKSISRRPALCFWMIFAAAILVRLALLPVEPLPTPLLHDEFSYLLAADTFAHGRLTNPPPPVPAAFETFHVNVWPSYQSMYLPGTGLALAVGQLLGSPWIAVLLTSALFCALVDWAVSGWLPRQYGLAAALIAMSVCLDWNHWFDNYFCLGLTAAAGALVIGSIPRIYHHRTAASTLPLGIGLCTFLLTRPYEGCMVSLPALLPLLWMLRRTGWKALIRLVATPLLMLLFTFGWLCYYNWRGTGHPLLFPYVVNYEQYHITGPFIFSRPRPVPVYHHDSMRNFYTHWEMSTYRMVTRHPMQFLRLKVKAYYRVFFAGNGLLLLLGLVAAVRKHSPFASLAFSFAGFLTVLALMAWYPYPQYGAPAAAVFLTLIALGLFTLRRIQVRCWHGTDLVRGWVLAQLLLTANIFYENWMKSPLPAEPRYASMERQKVEHLLQHYPGKHLCLVQYSLDHPGVQEWVYNGADLNSQRILWARSMDPDNDRKLIQAFPGRRVWLLRPDTPAQNLITYSSDLAWPNPNQKIVARTTPPPPP